MNDFYILRISIQNKNLAGAMRAQRNKSESAVRKIMEELKVSVAEHSVQSWLLTACYQGNTQPESIRTRCISQPAESWQAKPGCTGYIQARGTSGHAHRSHQ